MVRRLVLIGPAIIIFASLFVLPLGLFFVISFWRVRLFKLIPDVSLANYAKTLGQYGESIAFTLGIALAIGTITTLIAFGFAYVMRFKAGRIGPLLLFVALLTLFGGYLVKIYAWKTILGREGILNGALTGLGLIEQPLDVLLFNPGAVVVTLTHYLLPLAILPIYGALRGVEDVTVLAARDLGACPRRVLLDVILPQCRVGLLAGFAMSFLIAAGDYVTPRLVGGPSSSMIGNFIEGQFGLRMNAPLGAAMSFTTLALCASVIFLVYWMMKISLRPR